MTQPPMVTAACGMDILCHALESWTARPYTSYEHKTPEQRVPYCGSNPIADMWSEKAMTLLAGAFRVAVREGDNLDARGDMALAATFGISRIVEQNLVSVDPGVIEAAQAMGASPWRIIRTVLVPEALGPLVLGYTFALVAVVDMTAIAGAIGGGGLGQFAITYGYQRFNWTVTGVAVVIIIVIVQLAQFTGNALSRRIMRR